MYAIFCDGVTDVAVKNGVVRIKLHRLDDYGNGNKQQQKVLEVVIAMPLLGAMGLQDNLAQLRSELLKQGVLKVEAPVARGEVSPNFR